MFDCYYGNVSAKPNSALRQTETRKREAEIMGTNVKGLNVLNVHNCPAPEHLTPDPSRRTDSDRRTDGQTVAAAATFSASNLLAFALKQSPGPVKCLVFRHYAVVFFLYHTVSQILSQSYWTRLTLLRF